jgi:hypothetical protein
MQTSRDAQALHATLRYVVTSDIPAEHKRVLIEAVTDRIRALDAEDRKREALARDRGEWQSDELELIAAYLRGRAANSWQHADELLMNLAVRLNRDPRDVRVRATELGFGAAVDFRLAKLDRENEAED